MTNLKEYLDKASEEYYKGNPILPDDVFDKLADSIGYNSIGARQHEHIQKHLFPMYSLDKYYADEGKEEPLQGEETISSIKLDGAAIEALYIDGNLTRVLTRGDGKEGTNITDKFLDGRILPKIIGIKNTIQVSGEIVTPKSIPNARNYAAGALNLKDLNEFASRNIKFYAYGVQPSIDTTYSKDMIHLSIYFDTVIHDCPVDYYPTDGQVIRLNSNAKFEELGYTSKAPRGAYALKTRGEEVETTLLSVEWTTSKSGRVTPVAILEPVYIGDKLITRATLNNPGFIEALELQLGDRVTLILGGEIIPKITSKVI